jgi:hypothetical protein
MKGSALHPPFLFYGVNMKPVTSDPDIQDEIMSNADKIEKIKEMLSCLLSEKTKTCKKCDVVDECSYLQAAVFCVKKNA